MSGTTAYIHHKERATPKARYNPIPVPFHIKETVKQGLWEDMKMSIISPVPAALIGGALTLSHEQANATKFISIC